MQQCHLQNCMQKLQHFFNTVYQTNIYIFILRKKVVFWKVVYKKQILTKAITNFQKLIKHDTSITYTV